MLDIDWNLDRSSPIQLHLQIAGYLKKRVACGDWPIGTKLPSQRSLADILGVNRSTVVAAMEELAAEGIIKGNTGGGTIIINNTWTLFSKERSYNWNNYIYSGAHQANQTIVQQINQAEFEPGIIRLGSCEPSAELISDGMLRRILKMLPVSEKFFGYEEPRGALYLRKEICKYLSALGIKAEPSSVLITSGALQALQLISLGLLHSNSVVYLEKPSYLYSLRIFQSFGMQLSGIPLDEEGINIQELFARHKRKRGSMLFSIPTFHNPTGNVMSREKRKILIDKCGLERLPVIEDDVYREIWFDEQPPMPIKAFDKNGLVLYVGSMSKNMSPGLRIGWVVGPEQVIGRLADIKMQTDYGSSSISQYVAAEMLGSGLYTEHNKMLRKKVRIRRDAAIAALNKYFQGIASWNTPAGGYFIWLRLNNAISTYQLFVKALKNKVLIHPGDLYEYHSNQYIRISYSNASLEEIDFGIKVLSELVIGQLK